MHFGLLKARGFISAVTGQGITELKDMLWSAVNDDRNRIATPSITHRPLDGHHRVREEDEFIFDRPDTVEEDDDELFDDEEFDQDDPSWDDLDFEYNVDDEDEK